MTVHVVFSGDWPLAAATVAVLAVVAGVAAWPGTRDT
jgi:hypothetical protein